MKTRRIMKLWQMVIFEVLLLFIFSTIFLPFFRVTGSTIESAIKSQASSVADKIISVAKESTSDFDGFDDIIESGREEIVKQIEKSAEEYGEDYDEFLESKSAKELKKYGINPKYVSGWTFMTNSLVSRVKKEANYDSKDDEEKKNIDAVLSGFSTLKVLFWILYSITFVLMVLVPLSYGLKWSKFITLGTLTGYAIFGGIFSGFWLWGMVSSVISKFKDELMKSVGDGAFGFGGDVGGGDAINKYADVLISICSSIWRKIQTPIMMIVFIAFCLIFALAILSMVLFNKRPMVIAGQGGYNAGEVSGEINGHVNYDPFTGEAINNGMENGVGFDNGFGTSQGNNNSSGSSFMDNSGFGGAFTDGGIGNDYINNGGFGGPDTVGNDATVPLENEPDYFDPISPDESMDQPLADSSSVGATVPLTTGGTIAQTTPVMGKVMGISGVVKGKGYRLPEKYKIILGSDPGRVSFHIQARYISGVHCSIRYESATNTYIIKDHSTNGTFVNGTRLQTGVDMSFPAGTILSLADGQNQIRLG